MKMSKLYLFLAITVVPLLTFACSNDNEDTNQQEQADTNQSNTGNENNNNNLSDTAKALKQKVEYVQLETEFGTILFWLYNETPKHKENFEKLASEGFYDGTTFHRIIDGFMIQGGDPNSKDEDPNNDGQGGPGYTIPAEFNPEFKHVFGAVAAARMADQVNPQKESSGSQFYIVENKQGTPFLDNNYTVFGQVFSGFDVIETIAVQPKNQRDRPLEDIEMTVSIKKDKVKNLVKDYDFEVDWVL